MGPDHLRSKYRREKDHRWNPAWALSIFRRLERAYCPLLTPTRLLIVLTQKRRNIRAQGNLKNEIYKKCDLLHIAGLRYTIMFQGNEGIFTSTDTKRDEHTDMKPQLFLLLQGELPGSSTEN